MKRRLFLSTFSLAAMFPLLGARAQQKTVPVIGFLSGTSAVLYAPFVTAFREALGQAGFVEGRNVAIEYRWAEGVFDRLPAMAADLAQRHVDVIVTSGSTLAAMAAKQTTDTIPTVFLAGDDPVALGLVKSLSHPGGNRTGISFLVVELNAKRFDLLCELVPRATLMGLLVNPHNRAAADRIVPAVTAAARQKGLRLTVLRAGSEAEIETAFATLGQQHADGLLIGNDAFFNSRREECVALAARHRIPASYESAAAVRAGGLISYGASFAAIYRQLGRYTAKVLGGVKPAELPVTQPTKFKLAINLKTAKALGLTLPQSLLARADEVIE